MYAIILRELGPADNLQLEKVPDPLPGPGEVVVRLKAAALNHRDVWIRKGLYAGIKLPVILGSDGAGEVATVGLGVDPKLIGQAVVINPGLDWGANDRAQSAAFRILGLPDDGTYAELVRVPATHVLPKPADWTWEQAAALPLAGMTAYRAVATRAQVQAGEHVLVTGIGGGVSMFALQIARARGARVVVTSGSDDKIDRARKLGAEDGANYHSADWAKAIAAMTDGGPDVVIDSVGGDTMSKAIEIIRPGGRIVCYGATTGPVSQLEVRRIFWKQVSLLGTTMGTPQEFAAMLELYSRGSTRPAIDQVFGLGDAATAHRRMEDASQFGKIILRTS